MKHEILTKNGVQEVRLTPMRAIRARCLDCCGFQKHEVRLCPAKDCSLWPYRLGHVKRFSIQENSGKKGTFETGKTKVIV